MAARVRNAIHSEWVNSRSSMTKDWLQRRCGPTGDSCVRAPTAPGRFPWNIDKKRPVRHGWRSSGARPPISLQGRMWASVATWSAATPSQLPMSVGSKVPAEHAFYNTFIPWLRNRRFIWNRLQRVDRVEPSHFVGLGGPEEKWSLYDNLGFWHKLVLDSTVDQETMQSKGWKIGWHGTSIYCLHRLCNKGLEAGWSDNVEGGQQIENTVFYMAERESCNALYYTTYHQLREDGWLFGVLLQLGVNRDGQVATASALGKKSSLKRGVPQKVAAPRYLVLNAVYVHQVHILELIATGRDNFFNIEPGHVFELELDPEEDRGLIMDRSQQCADPPGL